MIDDKRLKLINSCIKLCVVYVSSYSLFLSQSLSTNIESYIKHLNTNKKNYYLNKIYNNLSKFVLLEDKKYNKDCYDKLIVDLINKVTNYFERNNIDKKYCSYLKKNMKEKSVYNIISFLLDEYYKYGHKEKIVIPIKKVDKLKQKKKEQELVLPALKKYSKPYILDKNNLKIYHLNYNEDGKTLVFNDETFLMEKKHFNECIKKNVSKIFEDEDSLSSFEKKRRIYLQSLFKVYKSLNELKTLDFSGSYPIQECYDLALDIVQNLYNEKHDFKSNNNEYLLVRNFTIKAYGYDNLIKEYDKVYKYVTHMLIASSGALNKEIKDNAKAIRSLYQYREFNNISDVIPSVDDIVNVYNNRVINNINFNYKKYFSHMDILFNDVCKYMSDDDIIEMYFRLKNCIVKNSFNSLLKDLIMLQNKFGNYLSVKKKMDFEEIVSKCFLEEVLTNYV